MGFCHVATRIGYASRIVYFRLETKQEEEEDILSFPVPRAVHVDQFYFHAVCFYFYIIY